MRKFSHIPMVEKRKKLKEKGNCSDYLGRVLNEEEEEEDPT